MTFVSLLEQRSLGTPLPARERLCRTDVILAIRRIALDLDARGTARQRFHATLGAVRGDASFLALHRLVMALCCQGRRPFVVGHPRSPLPSSTERHVLALLAAAQRRAESEVDIRLTTLLPRPWRDDANSDLAIVADALNCAGVPLHHQQETPPPRCRGWSREQASAQREH